MDTIKVGDLRISFDDAGTGEPVIFIHGLAAANVCDFTKCAPCAAVTASSLMTSAAMA